MKADVQINADARGLRVAVVASAYHADVCGTMERGAVEAFLAAGGREQDVVRVAAPGSFELPLLCDAVLARADVAGVVAVGCIVRGETRHDRHLGAAVTAELARLSVARGKPVGLAVLTVETMRQARARAGGKLGNKGSDAMRAVLACVRACEEVRR